MNSEILASMESEAILIRADANASIGTGHVMRCLALAEAWQDAGGEAIFAFAELPLALEYRLTRSGISLQRLKTIPGSAEDALATIARASQLSANWIVVDGDRFGTDFLTTVQNARVRVLLIDDFAERKFFPADLILNPNFGADVEVYRSRGCECPVLIGPRYVLLRREFHKCSKGQIREKGTRVLITLGGSDPDKLTPRIVTSLVECNDLQLTVVVGVGCSFVDDLRRLNTAHIRVLVDSQDMAGLMKDADLAVIAAGGTLWELLSVGCAVLSYARNTVQMRVVQSLAKDGIVVDMGESCHFDGERLASAVRRLMASKSTRERMASLGYTLIDGLGAARAVRAILHSGAGH